MNPVLINDAPNMPRREYPRPQWMRSEWMSLNGKWDFAFDFGNSGKPRGMVTGGEYPLEILVPFCPESKLSGIGHIDFIPAVWYRRTFTLDKLPEGRLLLHFGAVDYLSEVFINGTSVGVHKGGYSSFSYDITDTLCEGENVIVVNAQDDMRLGHQPHGKQCEDYKSRACSYTRTTGIWQTVWMEFVPSKYLVRSRMIPHAMDGALDIQITGCNIAPGDYVRLTAHYDGREVGTSKATFAGQLAGGYLTVSEKHFWNVGAPELYDLTVELIDGKSGEVIDTVESYFGLRDVAMNERALTINQKPVFMRLILDQGFNPDGIYTFPDDEYLRHDIELMLDLGFNGARLHQRVFEERTLYWADKLGYMVWGEYANGNTVANAQFFEDFMPEWFEVMERDFNHPALVGWCPLNETYHAMELDIETHRIMYDMIKRYDPTRPCIDASGGMHYDTDMFDVHDYEQDPETYRKYFAPMVDDPMSCHVPIDRYVGNKPRRPIEYKGQPYWVSEYGGTFWNPAVSKTSDEAWGYGDAPRTEEEFASRYVGLTKVLLEHPRICGFCYTQLTDIEQEQNGLFFYDRSRKLPDWVYDHIREANKMVAAVEME